MGHAFQPLITIMVHVEFLLHFSYKYLLIHSDVAFIIGLNKTNFHILLIMISHNAEFFQPFEELFDTHTLSSQSQKSHVLGSQSPSSCASSIVEHHEQELLLLCLIEQFPVFSCCSPPYTYCELL